MHRLTRKEDAMNMRVRQLWVPVLSTFLISVSVQFVALRVPRLPPWVFFTRNGVSIVLAPLWMLALPFIGALGASLSLRAGGNTRDRLVTALGSAWLNGGILTLGVPLSMVIERHFSLSIKLTAYIVYMIAWCLVPAVLLALGALPWLGHKATMRARSATGLERPDRLAVGSACSKRQLVRRGRIDSSGIVRRRSLVRVRLDCHPAHRAVATRAPHRAGGTP